jgi:catechol 2,3-dioxygenase-like lactoylglutathione lyase family enzyme
MFNHLSFGVSDLGRASHFYDDVLGTLGYRRTHSTDREAAYGPGDTMLFWLYPVADTTTALAAPRMHLAFDAPSEGAVEAFVARAVALGAKVVRPAGKRPDISNDYFGAIVDDPDGHRIEVVVTPATMH